MTPKEEVRKLLRDYLPDTNAACVPVRHLALQTLERALAEAHAEGFSSRTVAAAPNQIVNFYEREFYPLSNFSAFHVTWRDVDFDTSEAAYHWEKFPDYPDIRQCIHLAHSAHAAFKIAEHYRSCRRPDWDDVKVEIMRGIIAAKTDQHEYVRRKLLETGDRPLVECSWRDDFWGWGPNRDGMNMLGKLWMERRTILRGGPLPDPPEAK